MNYRSPPKIARELGIDSDTVIGLIRSGELIGINIANPNSQRPRFRVSEESLKDFLLRRQVRPAVQPARRKRQNENIKQYF